ncbi:MAG: hypothetical protein O3A00_09920 [Planctomycetota bacterium]|nr:hypothetical protein [Planctomycetota bacterium]
MQKWLIVLMFVGGAALSWGLYVPTVHKAAMQLSSSLRAFMFVGVAYFLVAVLVPAAMIFLFDSDPTAKANPNFKTIPVLLGLAAGFAGAAGALCVIFAATKAGPGSAIFVAPLVFAGAPIINTIVTITYFHPVKTMPDWRFFLGLGMAAAGAAMVMLFKPVDDKPHAIVSPPAAMQSIVAGADSSSVSES